MKQGFLIVFEGIDGTGKTTQVRMLAGALRSRGHGVVETREPTGGAYGKKIRQLYEDRSGVTKEEELRLFIADRREHVENLIKPSLAEGKIVITDRYYFSTAAYQGAAGHDPQQIIRDNEAFAPVPDLVFLLVLPVEVGIHRICNVRRDCLNDFEKEDSLKKVAKVFDSIDYDYIERIDATQTPEQVHEEVMRRLDRIFDK